MSEEALGEDSLARMLSTPLLHGGLLLKLLSYGERKAPRTLARTHCALSRGPYDMTTCLMFVDGLSFPTMSIGEPRMAEVSNHPSWS